MTKYIDNGFPGRIVSHDHTVSAIQWRYVAVRGWHYLRRCAVDTYLSAGARRGRGGVGATTNEIWINLNLNTTPIDPIAITQSRGIRSVYWIAVGVVISVQAIAIAVSVNLLTIFW
jgi:hypothetical protein